MLSQLEKARNLIREIPDYPIAGIRFQDLTPLLADGAALSAITSALAPLARDSDLIVGIEARGFIFAAALAHFSNRGFVPIRKAGKLPYLTYSQSYGLEYGEDTLEIHKDAIGSGVRALIIDDVLATGGTAVAALKLIERSGGIVSGIATVLELPALGGRLRIANQDPKIPVHSLFHV